VTFTYTTPGIYDPATDTTTGGVTVTVPARDGDRGRPESLSAARPHRVGEPHAAVEADTAGELPPLGATVAWGGETLTVKNIKRLAMNGTPTAAKIVVAR
jgi:hypothetical protein